MKKLLLLFILTFVLATPAMGTNVSQRKDIIQDSGYRIETDAMHIRKALQLYQNTETLSGDKTLVITDTAMQILDPNGANRVITLPAEASSDNITYHIYNSANGSGETLTVKNDGGTTISVLGPGSGIMFTCDGTNWVAVGKAGLHYDSVRGILTVEDIANYENNISNDDDIPNKKWVSDNVGGDITGVIAGSGLTGGGTSGSVTLNVGSSSTISVNADDIEVAADSIEDTQLAYNTGQHLTTSSSPTFAGLTTNGDYDMNGYYTVGQQNIADLASKGASYWFDGVDDDIVHTTVNFAADDEWSAVYQLNPTELKTITFFAGGSGSKHFVMFSAGGVGWRDSGGSYNNWPDLAVPENVDSNLSYIANGSGAMSAYLNGSPSTLNPLTITNGTLAAFVNIGDSYGSSTYAFNGQISRVLYFNLALTDDEVKYYSSGGEVPYAYSGASQDEKIIASDDRDFTTYANVNWTVYNGATLADGSGKLEVTSAASGASGAKLLTAYQGLIVGKKYRISADVWQGTTSTTEIQISVGNATNFTFSGVQTTYTTELIATTKTIYILLVSSDSGTFYIDNVTLTQIGCVLDLEPESVGYNQWLDVSGNGLHGTVSGSVPVNLPANHIEKVIKTTITGDSLWTDIVPAGYILERVIFEETAGNTATLDLGTSDGANDVFTGQTITASSITVIEIQKMWSSSSTQTLDLNDDQSGSSWNSASIDITLIMRRISLD